jgi:hypothetical protein
MSRYEDTTTPGLNLAPGVIGYRTTYFGLFAQVLSAVESGRINVTTPVINLQYTKSIEGVRSFSIAIETNFVKWRGVAVLTLLVGKPDEATRAELAERQKGFDEDIKKFQAALLAAQSQPVDAGTIAGVANGPV